MTPSQMTIVAPGAFETKIVKNGQRECSVSLLQLTLFLHDSSQYSSCAFGLR